MDTQKLFAERIGGESFGTSNEIYKFEKIKRAKAAAKAKQPDVELLDFGVWEPDMNRPALYQPEVEKYADAAQHDIGCPHADRRRECPRFTQRPSHGEQNVIGQK